MKHFFHSKTFSHLVIFCVTVVFVACKHKTNFNELTEVSYVGSIAPIINSNCAFSSCHGDSGFKKFNLTSYERLVNAGINPGAPEKSKLYKSLKSYGDEIMPMKPYNELTEKQIQLIYVWIGQGAKNN